MTAIIYISLLCSTLVLLAVIKNAKQQAKLRTGSGNKLPTLCSSDFIKQDPEDIDVSNPYLALSQENAYTLVFNGKRCHFLSHQNMRCRYVHLDEHTNTEDPRIRRFVLAFLDRITYTPKEMVFWEEVFAFFYPHWLRLPEDKHVAGEKAAWNRIALLEKLPLSV